MTGGSQTLLPQIPRRSRFSWGDLVVLLMALSFMALALNALHGMPQTLKGPAISLSRRYLPYYAFLSLARLFVAFLLSLVFMLSYGYLAARFRRSRWLLLPILDILQSVPLLSFLPVVLITFTAVFPQRLAIELSSVTLLFTCLGWNLTFAWYQTLITLPTELKEVGTLFRFSPWLRFKTIELPVALIGLIWNSIISWANGWFFLIAAEIFVVGSLDFRLPGLGSYLKEAATQSDLQAFLWGIGLIIAIIAAMDQFVWRPLLAWSARNKLEAVAGEHAPESWFYAALSTSRIVHELREVVFIPLNNWLEEWSARHMVEDRDPQEIAAREKRLLIILFSTIFGLALYGLYFSLHLLLKVTLAEWLLILFGLGCTLFRVIVALSLALAWTIPFGVAIGLSPRFARWFQPLVQIAASVPATAFFPAFLLLFLRLPFGLNLAAILLMLLGTQWYLLFNVIAGAQSIPEDLKHTAQTLRLSSWQVWRTLILPALFPYLVTGSLITTGAAWNACIVAEYVEFGGKIFKTPGVGSIITEATAKGNYPLLLAATLGLMVTVTLVNRLFWRRLYQLAQEKYRMD